MAFNYLVTANRATAVTATDTGNFTGPNDLNLITAKSTRIEVSLVTQDGLKLVREIGVYGSVSAIKLFRPQGYTKDLLFFLTAKHHVAILECVEGPQPDSYEIVTLKDGDVADPASSPAETNTIVIIDPQCRMIGLRLYTGLFKILPLNKFKLNNPEECIEAFNIRMEETVVPDINFLHGYSNPTIGFIYKDMSGTSHVTTYEVSLKEKEFSPGPWFKNNIANEASLMIPVPQPFGGVIVVALESILYINGTQERVRAPPMIKTSPIQCYASIDTDGTRYLLADLTGRLYCLILEAQDYRLSDKLEVKDMRLEYLGETSIADSITYLDNAMVFIGSRLGDSQLIRLLVDPDENGSFIQVCETYANLGPISDMCLVDLEKQGQGQLVTCSGHMKDGTLRIIRNGIGLNEKSSIDLANIRGVWSLKLGKKQRKINYLLITFIIDSFLWHCEDDGDFTNCIESDGFDRSHRTILSANVSHDLVIQVTTSAIRVISAETMELMTSWTLPSQRGIFKVSYSQDLVICADGNLLYVFKIQPDKLELLREITLHAEVACIDLNPILPTHQLLSVGFWFDMNIVIYSLPEFNEIHREELNSDICMIPRSIVTAKLEDNHYLLCALGDGSVHYFNLDPMTGALTNCKKVTLGTYETILRPFKSQSTTSIFVCSDRPTVIYSTNNKLVFSNVNLKEVNFMCTLDTSHYPDSLALVSDTDILFGTIDEIQKLHIKTIPLFESPLRIVHQQSTQTLGLLSTRMDYQDINGFQPVRPSASTQAHSRSYAISMSTGAAKPPGLARSGSYEVETSSLLIINQHTFEVLHAHQFMPTENACSILSTKLGEGEEEYFVVGTAFVLQDEPEPKQGRLVVLKWTQDMNLQQVAELSIKGSPYTLCEFDNKFLAGVNATVNLVELNSRRDLHIECTYVNAIMALYLKRRNQLILMGDLMRSMSLFSYKPLQAHFEEVARDFNPAWTTEVEILDDEHFLGFEHTKNIYVCERDTKAVNEHDRLQMEAVGLFHLGDTVNVCLSGSLVMQHPSERSIEIKRTTLFGTISGVIGLIMTIDESLFRKLDDIQSSLSRVVNSVGHIDHREWRAFQGNKHSQPAMGFIDGDLVETFLDLKRAQMQKVAEDCNCSVEDLVKLIEELSRLH